MDETALCQKIDATVSEIDPSRPRSHTRQTVIAGNAAMNQSSKGVQARRNSSSKNSSEVPNKPLGVNRAKKRRASQVA